MIVFKVVLQLNKQNKGDDEMKIKRIFIRQIRGKDEYEIENKAREIFRSIISELDKEGICIFETPEAPSYYQERKFVLPLEKIYVSVKKDLIQKSFTLTIEHFERSSSTPFYCEFGNAISMLEDLARKHHLKEQEKK